MKKYMILTVVLTTIFLSSSLAFAGYTQTDYMKGTLKEVSVYNATTGAWIALSDTEQVVTMGSSLTFKKSLDGGLPAGTYTKLRFVFKNVFDLSGRVVIDDGIHDGVYYSVGGATDGTPSHIQFKKTLSAPGVWTLTVDAASPETDDGFTTWCDGTYCYTEDTINQKIDEQTGAALQLYVQKGWFWSDYGDKATFSGLGDFQSIDADTLQANRDGYGGLDGFEIDYQ